MTLVSYSLLQYCNLTFVFELQSMHWASPKKETMLEGGNSTSEAEQETGYVVIKGQHEAGDLGFLRTGKTLSQLFLMLVSQIFPVSMFAVLYTV